MKGFASRQLHFVVLFAIVTLATLPNWQVYAQDSDDVVFEENLKPGSATNAYSEAEKRMLEGLGEEHKFEAEVSRLMGLIINSLYSNKDVFLRELISNASDALDKIRLLSLTDNSVLGDETELRVRIKADPDARTLTIEDTGVGMTKKELVDNLGTIAKSGTAEFLQKVQDNDSLIGQFGVGFYSAFLVADRVTVTSKSNDDDQYVWTSDSNGSFSVTQDPEGNTLGRGTRITLHIKEDSLSFLQPNKLQALATMYSEFINFPIYLWTSHIESHEVFIEGGSDDDDEEEDFDDISEGEEEEDDDEGYYDTVEETVWDWELINNTQPLWARDPEEISDEDYKKFYHAISKDDEEPYSWAHFKAEGDVEFRAIIYLPQEPPADMFNQGRDLPHGLKLYVRRVFITDDFEDVIPRFLAFVRGVIDSNSLPLNVSREILQQHKSLGAMQKKIVRKIIAMIQELSEDEEKYEDFYDDYRVHLKLGVLEDKSNQDRLAKLLRFYSSKSGDSMTSLESYVERMKEGQDQIFFIGGESLEAVENSPLLERLTSRGYEVLYFVDSIDEYWVQTYQSFDGFKLVNIGKDTKLNLEDDLSEEEKEALDEEYAELLPWLKKTLSNKITKAVLSTHLTSTPSAIVSSSYSYSANMERILRAQALGQQIDPFMASRKILELNPSHPLIQKLNELVLADEDDQQAKDIASLLYDTAALHSGYNLNDPSEFALRIHRMMAAGLNIDASTFPEKPAFPEEEEQEEAEEDSHVHDEL